MCGIWLTITENPDFLVIVGSEINTEAGDIIGLFLNEEIKSRNSMEVMEEIKEQGGIVVLPHPYRGHKLNDEIIKTVDAIEGYNSRSSQKDNNEAIKLANKYNKPIVAGSDAHFASEIGLGKTIINAKGGIKREILNGRTELEVSQSPAYLQPLSQIIRSVKMKEYRNIAVLVASCVIKFVKRR